MVIILEEKRLIGHLASYTRLGISNGHGHLLDICALVLLTHDLVKFTILSVMMLLIALLTCKCSSAVSYASLGGSQLVDWSMCMYGWMQGVYWSILNKKPAVVCVLVYNPNFQLCFRQLWALSSCTHKHSDLFPQCCSNRNARQTSWNAGFYKGKLLCWYSWMEVAQVRPSIMCKLAVDKKLEVGLVNLLPFVLIAPLWSTRKLDSFSKQ